MIGHNILRTCNDAFPDTVWNIKMERGFHHGDMIQLTVGIIAGREVTIKNEEHVSHPDKKEGDHKDLRTVRGFNVSIEGGYTHVGTDLLRTIVKAVQLSAEKATKTSDDYAEVAKGLREFEAEVMKQIKQ